MRKRSGGARRVDPREAVFTARIVKDEDGGYFAYCEELPGCITQGKTIAQTEANFAEALAVYLETLADLGSPRKRRRRHSRDSPAKVTRFALTPMRAAGGR